MKNYINLFFLGSLTSLLFPPFFFIPMGFLIIPYFYYKILNSNNLNSIKGSFLEGFLYGLGLNIILFYWLKNPFFVEEETKNLFFLSYIYIIYASLYFGFLFVFVRLFKNKKIQIIVFPLIFVLLEIIRTKLFIGFPWNLFGYIFSSNLNLFQIVKYIGTYGLSYVVIIIFLIPTLLLNIFNKKDLRFNFYYFISILIIVTILYAFALKKSNQDILQNNNKIDFIIYQNNTLQKDKWDLDKMQNRFQKLIEFIEKNSKNTQPTVIVFSETEIPYVIKENDNTLKFIQSKLDNNTVVLVGAIRKNFDKDNYYNTMYRINSKSIGYFDKKILVPFGEYIPLKNIFPFVNKLTHANSEFSKGNKFRNLNLIKNINFIPSICYENIFFEKIISERNINNKFIINITNDSWFGKYQGPYQHFYQSILRSVELGKYLIRVSNNGISAIINPEGKILYSTKLNEKIVSKYSLTINDNYQTFYFHERYLIFYLYLVISLLICCFFQFRSRNEKH